MITAKYTVHLSRNVVTCLYCNFGTGQVNTDKIRGTFYRRSKSPRMHRFVGPKKESSFIDVENEDDSDDFYEPRGDFLENAYKEHKWEKSLARNKLRAIMTKKKLMPKEKQPCMLTWSEKEHMRYLHKLDPEEWSAENLSKSFPVLPEAAKKILRAKWVPKSEESIKEKDEATLDNWEKFKAGELKVSPELKAHLEKFVDKRKNLKAQLENPKFFHLEKVESKWDKIKSNFKGPHSYILQKYQQDLERLKLKQTENKLLESGENDMKQIVMRTDGDHEENLKDIIDREKKIQNIKNEDNFLINMKTQEYVERKPMTLDEMKEDVLKKTGKGNVSAYDELVLKKILGKGKDNKLVKNNERNRKMLNSIDSEKSEQKKIKPKESLYLLDKKNISEESQWKTEDFEEKEISDNLDDYDFSDINPKFFKSKKGEFLCEGDIGGFFNPEYKNENENEKEHENVVNEKKVKKPVNFYNTEKDKLKYSELSEILSETCFMRSKRLPRRKKVNQDSDFSENPSPHVAGERATYFTYNYPDKITIPKDKVCKGMTYRVKDCFYDENGDFLYRVAGVDKQ